MCFSFRLVLGQNKKNILVAICQRLLLGDISSVDDVSSDKPWSWCCLSKQYNQSIQSSKGPEEEPSVIGT